MDEVDRSRDHRSRDLGVTQQHAEQIKRPNSNEDEEKEGLQIEANTNKGDRKKMNSFCEQIAKAI